MPIFTLTLIGVSVVVSVFLLPMPSAHNAASAAKDVDQLTLDIERTARDHCQAYTQKDWPRAIGLALRLNKLVPGNSTHQYNLACVYSLNGEPDRAIEWLGKAAQNGFSRLTLFETDTDLGATRSHEGYKAVHSAVKSNRGRILADLKARFEETPLHVVLPPEYNADQAAPLIVALHGYGGGARGVTEEWRNVAAEMGAIVIAPQAIFPIPGQGGVTWIDPNRIDDPTCQDDAEFLVQLTVEYALANHRIDKERMILVGFSQGGIIAVAAAPRSKYRFAGAIPMAGEYLPRFDAPPKAVGDSAPRFYFMIGERDRDVAVASYRLAVKEFTAAGYVAKLRIYPRVGHRFPDDRDKELRRAIDFVLKL